jgi:UDP-N-acetylmuramoyl-tripeptide--D-alanyl-D-alanine ligase
MPSQSAGEANALWLFDDLVGAAGGRADGAPTRAIGGFSIDTRSLRPGDVFVALKDQRDGHDFVSGAFAAGAAVAVVSEAYQRQAGDGALVRVAETLDGLRAIARAARGRLGAAARVIAVTGSAGKTGTTAMLRACLERLGATHAPEKSFNNHWGVPLTLARMPAGTSYAVIEIGMSNAGEISPLTRLVRPHVAIVTNVLPVHVGNFADGEIGVANAKAEIFEGLQAGGTAIILRDSPHYARLKASAEARGARVVTFGTDGHADCRLLSCNTSEPSVDGAQTVRATLKGQEISFRLGTPGDHIAINALAAVCALDALGLDQRDALDALATAQAQAGRGQRLRLQGPNGDILLLDESYNANPASMRAALASLAGATGPGIRRRVAIMGDMLELGSASPAYHRDLQAATSAADLVFACGPNMRHLFDELPASKKGAWAASSADLLADAVASLRPGDAVMVKGSLGSRMAPIVDAIKKRFAGAALSG